MTTPKPKRHGDERSTLRATLDQQRASFLTKIDGLQADQLAQPLPPSTLTLGGLAKHLALVEDHWFQHSFAGERLVEPWASAPFDDDPDWELNTAQHDSPEQLRTWYLDAIARSNAVYDAAPTLDQMNSPANTPRMPFDLRWVTLHMIEETARHAGHADLIRESIDGAVGDQPA